MSKNQVPQPPQFEKKERAAVWLYPSTLKIIDGVMEKANCRSRSEFLEDAAKFYAGYVSADDVVEFLPPIILHALRGTIQCSEERVSRLLFKLAVEMDMMMNVLAAQMNVPEDALAKLRGMCVRHVKETNGSISYKAAQDRQNGLG